MNWCGGGFLVQRHSLSWGFIEGGMGPGAPGFARVSSMNSTGKLALAHATRKYKREGSLVYRQR